ncbi:MAG: ferredoxin [Cupriavidus sp.]|nr:ferredoxin [Cupriavidus sp.]
MNLAMYVILTSKRGQFRTEAVPGVDPVETWEYLFYGRCTATFVIAELSDAQRALKVRVIDEMGGPDAEVVNHVPTKFLERFETLDAARGALQSLAHFGSMDLALRKQ